MYQPIKNFPTVNKNAVPTAPMRTFGSTLKMVAKSALMTVNDNVKSAARQMTGESGSKPLMYLLNAASAALRTSEVSSRKPIASTMENERKRSRTSRSH